MKDNDFNFNPLDFGFRPFADFPKLKLASGDYFPDDTSCIFVKVIAIGGERFANPKDRIVFWYIICILPFEGKTDTFTFLGHSFDSHDKRDPFHYLGNKPRTEYFGPIFTKVFAEQLVRHLGPRKRPGVAFDAPLPDLNEELLAAWS